jgi:hypothetical protein
MRCEPRTLDDIRALGGNDADDERRFAAAARVSDVNLALYRTFAQPFVRACVTPQVAEMVRRMHPLRMQYELFSNANPAMAWLEPLAAETRSKRAPAASDNPFLQMQQAMSDNIVKGLDVWRDTMERFSERTFMSVYGLPAVQASVGIDPKAPATQREGDDPLHQQLVEERIAELKARIPEGGIREATVRALLYIGLARGSVDERSFEVIRRIRANHKDLNPLPLADFKAMVRQQYFMLLIDMAAAVAAIPAMLPADAALRTQALKMITEVVESTGELAPEGKARLQQVKDLFLDKPSPASVIDMQGKRPSIKPKQTGAL